MPSYKVFQKGPFLKLKVRTSALVESLEGLKNGSVCIAYSKDSVSVNRVPWTRYLFTGLDQPLVGTFMTPGLPRDIETSVAFQTEGYQKLADFATELLAELGKSGD